MESFATFRSRLMRSIYWRAFIQLLSLGSRLRTILEFLFRGGDGGLKYHTASLIRPCPQPAAMGVDDRPANRQPHPCSAGLCGVEGIENAIELFRIDARPGIMHCHKDPGVVLSRADQ